MGRGTIPQLAEVIIPPALDGPARKHRAGVTISRCNGGGGGDGAHGGGRS